MRHFAMMAITLGAAAMAATAVPPSFIPRSSLQPIAPKQDPWYTAPDGFESTSPGDVLRTRKAPGRLASIVANCSGAYNVLFRTTDSNNNATWAVTTLFIPETQGGPLLSYQIPYDSANLDDSPSYQLYNNPPSDIAEALGRSWYVNVPDFEGPLASFTAGIMSGHATLDSVRAIRSAGLGIARDARYALWGYSGGALASEWAAELQPSYAPELSFSGAALGGLTPNITSVIYATSGQASAFLVPEGVVGLASQHPAAKTALVSEFQTTGSYTEKSFYSVETISSSDAKLAFADKNMSLYFKDGLAVLQLPAIQEAVLKDGIMGTHGTPKMPLYVYKAIHDEVSPIQDTDSLVKAYCRDGVSIAYERNSVGGHAAEQTNGDPAAVQFLAAVLEGYHNTSGCETKNVSVSIDTSPQR